MNKRTKRNKTARKHGLTNTKGKLASKNNIKTAIYTVISVSDGTAVITPVSSKTKKLIRLKVYTSLAVKAGERVQIGFATRKQVILNTLCLVVPLLCAALACLLSPEQFKATGVIVSCVTASIIIGAFARKGKNTDGNTLQIVRIIK